MDLADPMFVIVVGDRGYDRTVVAQRLSELTGWPLADGEDFRAHASDGDGDRPWTGWLDAVAAWIDAHEVRGDSAVVTCPRLTVGQRAHLRRGRDTVQFLLLSGAESEPLEPGEPGLELDADAAPDDLLRRAMHELDLR